MGQSGPYVSAKRYAGCSTSSLPTTASLSTESVTQTWALQTIDGRSELCMNSAVAGFVGTATESDCVEVIDTAGTLGTHVKITTIDLNKVSTTLSN